MAEAKKILLLGGGGHCMSVLDSLLSSNEYDSIGIIDKNVKTTNGKEPFNNKSSNHFIMGIPIIGDDNELEQLFAEGYTHAFIATGSIGDVSIRRKLYHLVKNIGFRIPNIFDKTSVISKYTNLGEGIFFGKNTVINSGVTIGNGAILNTSSVIEHECTIGDFVHIAPGSILNGNVSIGTDTHIGAGSVIKQGIHVGKGTMIGMGSIVLNDIRDNVIAYGNPCKVIESVKKNF